MTETIIEYAQSLTSRARQAAVSAAAAATRQKNAFLTRFAELLAEHADTVAAANTEDLTAAEQTLSTPLLERLALQPKQLTAAIAGVRQIADLDDPVGTVEGLRVMPSGIQVGKMRTPLGVILMIYESRPNVTIDAAALAIKAGNAIILRGGKESRRTNAAIGECLAAALSENSLADAAQIVSDYDHAVVTTLLRQENGVDLVIPRGGKQLIAQVAAESRAPVLKHLDGNCHLYVDADADIDMAAALIENAKTRRYGVCNAAESVLIHRACAGKTARLLAPLRAKGVTIRACEQTLTLLQKAGGDGTVAATEEDWSSEYLAPIISVKIVESLDAAIAHINHYGSGHTDAIISDNIAAGWKFLREVDSSSVLINASTGYADGGEFGLGAEIGISTDKLHARGPVGLAGLTTQKYIVLGHGECRA